MKICEEKTESKFKTVYIPGHIYRRKEGKYMDQLYFANYSGLLSNLRDGSGWANTDQFGNTGGEGFEDVTDQYCLKKIED